MPRFGMVASCTEYSMEPAELAQAIEDRGDRALAVVDAFAALAGKLR